MFHSVEKSYRHPQKYNERIETQKIYSNRNGMPSQVHHMSRPRKVAGPTALGHFFLSFFFPFCVVVLLLSVSFSFTFFPFEKKKRNPLGLCLTRVECWAIKKKNGISLSLLFLERENFQPVMHLPHLIVCTTQICNTSNNRMGKKGKANQQNKPVGAN